MAVLSGDEGERAFYGILWLRHWAEGLLPAARISVHMALHMISLGRENWTSLVWPQSVDIFRRGLPRTPQYPTESGK
jgi:hypothetical protein